MFIFFNLFLFFVWKRLVLLNELVALLFLRWLRVIELLAHDVIGISQADANLNVILVPLGVWGHIVHDVVLSHEEIAQVPSEQILLIVLGILEFRLEDADEALIARQPKIAPRYQEILARNDKIDHFVAGA